MDLHCWSIYLGSLTECRSWLERIPHCLHGVHPCATNSTKSKVEKYKLPVFWPPWSVVWRNSLFLKYLFINTKSPFWNLLRDLWWCRYLEAHQQRGQKCDNGGGIPKSVIIEVGLEKVLGWQEKVWQPQIMWKTRAAARKLSQSTQRLTRVANPVKIFKSPVSQEIKQAKYW